MSDADRLAGSVAYVLGELGVVPHPRDAVISRSAMSDTIVVCMKLPSRTESVKIDGLAMLARPKVLVDSLVAARDQLFSATLAHIAEHDYDVRAMLEALKRTAAKRESILRVLAEMEPPR